MPGTTAGQRARSCITREGTHSESGRYTAEDWLKSTPRTATTTPDRYGARGARVDKHPRGTLRAMEIASAAAVAYDEAAEQRHLALRDEFLLDPDVVFLNHGSFGACPRPVFERYQTWQV